MILLIFSCIFYSLFGSTCLRKIIIYKKGKFNYNKSVNVYRLLHL